ncbi:MAG: hybrid sensor histidine kinase/response regulator [Sulfurimonas sp.]|nr:MAG: hybrid sensor histidine kinase/response regulator [Sulfurimonas sp.]
MQLGLKNRLRLISLLPILVLFSLTSIYVYNSFDEYHTAQILKNELTKNNYLNDLITDIARERGMSSMYLGKKSDNTLKSLKEQRKIVDKKVSIFEEYIKKNKLLHNHSIDSTSQLCLSCKEKEIIKIEINKIKKIRLAVNLCNSKFENMFDIYTNTQNSFIKQLEHIMHNQVDKDVNELYTLYIAMVYAKEFAGIERGYMSFVIARSTKLTEADLNKWVSIIGRSDSINYDTLHDEDLRAKLDALFKDEQNIDLFEDINSVRTGIVSAAATADYPISSGIWFAMQSEKISIISDAQDLLLKSIYKKVELLKASSLKILLITIAIWLVAIIFGALGYLLSNEIANNIKHLEDILRRAAQGSSEENEDINLHTSKGTNLAYNLLENIIDKTKQDKQYAQDASEAKSMFLANMSHEIRTPLNGIVGFTDLLKNSELKAEQKEFVDVIEKSSQNLLDVIKNILDISKIESNKHEVEDTIFNPLEEFQSAVDVYAVKSSEKNIDLACFIDPKLEIPLRGDPTKIKEVLINLISNAIKFTDINGFINVHIRKKISTKTGITKIYFAVQDNGIGVSKKQRSKIFEAFSQADKSITRKYGGTGLGLTISSNFIKLLGGKLDLASKKDYGTTFFFELEFKESDTNINTSKNKFSFLKVAILRSFDKVKEQDIYIKEYLDYYGVKFELFRDIQEIKDKKYDLIFVDLDYIGNISLEKFSQYSAHLVPLTKASKIKSIDSLNLDICKILYDPIHTLKIKQTLQNYVYKKYRKK